MGRTVNTHTHTEANTRTRYAHSQNTDVLVDSGLGVWRWNLVENAALTEFPVGRQVLCSRSTRWGYSIKNSDVTTTIGARSVDDREPNSIFKRR